MTRSRWMSMLGISGMLLLAGCATAGPSVGDDSPSRNPDVITRAEMADRTFTNAYAAVDALRPSWLRAQPSNSFTSSTNEMVVYVDAVRFGGPDSLRSLSVEMIATIERVNAMTATQRWGTGHSGGAIMVVTRRGPAN